MDDAGHSRLRDGLITIGAVYLALTIAGISATWLGSVGIGPLGSLAAYAALLTLYAFRTGPGWRSPIPVYFAGALIYPILLVAMLLGIRWLGQSQALLGPVFTLAAGINVGIQARGGADTPLEAYVGPWLANFLLPIVVVIGIKEVVRYFRDD
jgi:hypothetical protein